MAKRPHWTTEEVLQDILNDEEPAEEWEDDMTEEWEEDMEEDMEEVTADRDEPVMQGKNFLIGMKVGSKTKLNTDIIYYNVHVEMNPPSTDSNPAQGKY